MVFGRSPTLDVTPQFSPDAGVNWYDNEDDAEAVKSFTQATAAGQDVQICVNVAPLMRFKLVAGGTTPGFTGTITTLEEDLENL